MTKKIYSIDEIKQKVTPILKKAQVKRAILFGSYAKGTADERSDIDIYIDSGGYLDGLNFFGVYGRVEERLKKRVDLIEASDVITDSKVYNEIFSTGVDILNTSSNNKIM